MKEGIRYNILSPKCFSLGWPMRVDGDFFKSTSRRTSITGKSGIQIFLRTYRCFDRLWIAYIVALQAMLLLAWGHADLQLFSTIFIMVAFLRFIQGLLDIPGLFFLEWLPEIHVRLACSAVLTLSYVYGWWYNTILVIYIMTIIVSTVQSWSKTVYVSRTVRDSHITVMKYTCFIALVLFLKFTFSFFVMIQPLIEPTMRKFNDFHYTWNDLFTRVTAIIALWSPIFSVYFMDTHIWYIVVSVFFGGVIRACDFFGGVIRACDRWRVSPLAGCLKWSFSSPEHNASRRIEADKFAGVWNDIINSIREEDLISNLEVPHHSFKSIVSCFLLLHNLLNCQFIYYREMDFLQFPDSSKLGLTVVQFPTFFLAGKIRKAIDMAVLSQKKDDDLWRSICKDEHMKFALIECYETLKYILTNLDVGETEKRTLYTIISEVDSSISKKTLLANFRMSELPELYKKFVKLVGLLRDGDKWKRREVALILKDILEVVNCDMMVNESCKVATQKPISDVSSPSSLSDDHWRYQINRLYILLTGQGSAFGIPANLKAQRRIAKLTNSLMEMPLAPRLSEMLSFSVFTPYYNEDTVYSLADLYNEDNNGDSVIVYLKENYPDEWKNFMERINCQNEFEFWASRIKTLQLRHWISLRGQTLCRTVRGMMYFRRSVKLLAGLDMEIDLELSEAVADMKFTCITTCKNYGDWRRNNDPRAKDIFHLMTIYPSLRVAYIDEVREREGENPPTISYYSVLVKAVGDLVQEIYRIKLPATIKSEKPDHATIFSRGEVLMANYKTQDKYLEEAFKMCHLLKDLKEYRSVPTPLREQICTGCLSSLGWMSYQETSFITFGQRVLARPLESHFHFSHPDLCDRILHITGGSKLLSDDIFAGFCSTLRPGGDIGRSFGVQHIKFAEIYRRYSRSHFNKAFLWLFNIGTYLIYGESVTGYSLFLTGYMIVLAVSWILSPFIFNPWAFERHKILEDWKDWCEWMKKPVSDSKAPSKSWEAWWEEEQEDTKHTGYISRILSIALSSRLFLYQYGVVNHIWGARSTYLNYHFHRSVVGLLGVGYLFSLVAVGATPAENSPQTDCGADNTGCISGVYITVPPFIAAIPAVLLSSIPSCWAFLLIFQACRPITGKFWEIVMGLARWYDYLLGFVVFVPIMALSYIPCVFKLHTRLAFDPAFRSDIHIKNMFFPEKRRTSH